MNSSLKTASDQPKNNSGNCELSDVILRLERFGMVLQEIQKLCGSLGIDFEDEDIQGTFNRIKDVFHELQKESKNEKKLRNEIEGSLQALQQELERREIELSHSEEMLNLEQQQTKQNEELIKKLDHEKSDIQRGLQEMEGQLLQELNEEKRRRITMESIYLEAESRAKKEESLRRESETSYQNVVNILDEQRAMLKQQDQEKLQLQTLIKQLEIDKEYLELKNSALHKGDLERTKLEDILLPSLAERKRRDYRQEVHPLSDHLLGKTPTGYSTPFQEFDQFSDRDRVFGFSESKNIANSLVLPPFSSHTTEMPVPYRGVSNFGQSIDGSRSYPRARAEGISIRNSEPRSWRDASEFPPSVVSSTLVHNDSFQINNAPISFGNLSPMSTGLMLNSETSDSATADDSGFDQSVFHHRALDSFDYGAPSSTVPLSEDYDSVNVIEPTDPRRHRWVNPLQWAWERKGEVVGGVASGVQNAAKTGAIMSKNLLTFVTVVAFTAGTANLVNRNEEIDSKDFSDVEEEGAISSSHPSSLYTANDFIG